MPLHFIYIYILHVFFRQLKQLTHTIYLLRAQIAKSLTRQRYGFVFGCNMFLALLIETVLTAVVVDEAGFGVDVQTQVCSQRGSRLS